jgi:transposase
VILDQITHKKSVPFWCALTTVVSSAPSRRFYTMARLSDKDKMNIISMMKVTKCITTTAKKVHCSAKTVRRWWNRWQTTRTLLVKKGAERKHASSDAAAKTAMDMLLQQECNGAADVARELQSQAQNHSDQGCEESSKATRQEIESLQGQTKEAGGVEMQN